MQQIVCMVKVPVLDRVLDHVDITYMSGLYSQCEWVRVQSMGMILPPPLCIYSTQMWLLKIPSVYIAAVENCL